MNKKLIMLLTGVLLLDLGKDLQAADASPPELMIYQGYLTDGDGVPLGNLKPVNYDIVFRIYNDKAGGGSVNLLWSEQQTVEVGQGYFTVLLGEGSAVINEPSGGLGSVFETSDSSDRFIGITVGGLGGDAEITPRLRLMTSPFSFMATHARQAESIAGVSGDVLTTKNGNVGINKAAPSLMLDVEGDIKASGNILIENNLAVGKSSAPTAALDVAGAIKSSAGLDSSGNSSITGTLSFTPGVTNNKLIITPPSGASFNHNLTLYSDSSASYIWTDNATPDLRLGGNDQDTLVIKPDGKVGIGTPTPAYDLEVNGSLNLTGGIKRNGQSAFILTSVETVAADKKGGEIKNIEFTATGTEAVIAVSGGVITGPQNGHVFAGGGYAYFRMSTAPETNTTDFGAAAFSKAEYAYPISADVNRQGAVPAFVFEWKVDSLTPGNKYYLTLYPDGQIVTFGNDGHNSKGSCVFDILVTQFDFK